MTWIKGILPWWARWLGLCLVLLSVFTLGQQRGQRIEGEKHIAYIARQAAQTIRIAQAQQIVVTQTEIKYRDRIKTIYIKGKQIEKQVPIYVTQLDNASCTINTGFVRSHNAAWTGNPAGPAAESDRKPTRISLTQVAEVATSNATSCRAWREIALGLRDYYTRLQAATNAAKQ